MISRFLALVFALLLSLGCDFSEPISEQPSHEIDTKLPGMWVWTRVSGEKESVLTITKKDSRNYSFFDTNLRTKGIMWHTTVGTTDFLTIKVENSSASDRFKKKPYMYCTWAIDGNQVHVRFVNEESKFASDEKGSVTERIKRHLQDKDFFGKEHVFKRAENAQPPAQEPHAGRKQIEEVKTT